MTAASFKRVAEAPAHTPVSVDRPLSSEWTPPALPDSLGLIKVMGGVLALTLLSCFLLSVT
ncbi:hypothetical protein [Deinococcus sp.]|uniref:hypothetical protein n=1 Tax=Deinococcus sp. TaxID=47478 RepID=UPI0025BFF5D4|nr:hypothetical protein [Deinococcus sp.]